MGMDVLYRDATAIYFYGQGAFCVDGRAFTDLVFGRLSKIRTDKCEWIHCTRIPRS